LEAQNNLVVSYKLKSGILCYRKLGSKTKISERNLKNIICSTGLPLDLMMLLIIICVGVISKLGWLTECQACHVSWFLVFNIPAVSFNFQNPGIISTCPMTPFISVLGQFRFVQRNLSDCAYVSRSATGDSFCVSPL
jgi:hypothetical protein